MLTRNNSNFLLHFGLLEVASALAYYITIIQMLPFQHLLYYSCLLYGKITLYSLVLQYL